MANNNITEKKIERDIEVLKIFKEFYKFEQNHLANDFMTRIVFTATIGITISIACLNIYFNTLIPPYLYVSIITFISAFLIIFRYTLDLKKKRDNILIKRNGIREEILKRYILLGVNVKEFADRFN